MKKQSVLPRTQIWSAAKAARTFGVKTRTLRHLAQTRTTMRPFVEGDDVLVELDRSDASDSESSSLCVCGKMHESRENTAVFGPNKK